MSSEVITNSFEETEDDEFIVLEPDLCQGPESEAWNRYEQQINKLQLEVSTPNTTPEPTVTQGDVINPALSHHDTLVSKDHEETTTTSMINGAGDDNDVMTGTEFGVTLAVEADALLLDGKRETEQQTPEETSYKEEQSADNIKNAIQEQQLLHISQLEHQISDLRNELEHVYQEQDAHRVLSSQQVKTVAELSFEVHQLQSKNEDQLKLIKFFKVKMGELQSECDSGKEKLRVVEGEKETMNVNLTRQNEALKAMKQELDEAYHTIKIKNKSVDLLDVSLAKALEDKRVREELHREQSGIVDALKEEITLLKVQSEVYKEDYGNERIQRTSLAAQLESLRMAHEGDSNLRQYHYNGSNNDVTRSCPKAHQNY